MAAEVAGEEDRVEYIASYQDVLDGILNFPMYYSLRRVFSEDKPCTYLQANIERQRQAFRELAWTANFVDNHDFNRFLNLTYDYEKLKSALAFILFWEGVPIIYAGTELGFSGGQDPDNRESMWPYFDEAAELYQFIKTSLLARKSILPLIINTPANDLYVDDTTYIYHRGLEFNVVVAISSLKRGTGGGTVTVEDISVPDGTTFFNIYNDLDVIVVTGGTTEITFADDVAPKVYVKVG